MGSFGDHHGALLVLCWTEQVVSGDLCPLTVLAAVQVAAGRLPNPDAALSAMGIFQQVHFTPLCSCVRACCKTGLARAPFASRSLIRIQIAACS